MPGRLSKSVASAVGIGLCLLALLAARLPTAGVPPGLDLRLIAVPPGELTVSPVGVLASGRAMQAGDRTAGTLTVRNIAGQRLRLRLLALPSTRGGPARAVHLRATAAGAVLAEGSLAQGARSPRAGIEIPARGSRRIAIGAWLPAGARGYRGRVLDVTLEFRSRPAGRR
jgi:hypothetical protein